MGLGQSYSRLGVPAVLCFFRGCLPALGADRHADVEQVATRALTGAIQATKHSRPRTREPWQSSCAGGMSGEPEPL